MIERRRHPRIAIRLNVTLLNDTAMPRGCRVRDVSQGGMLLQFDHPGNGTGLEPGHSTRVRAALKHGDQRRTLILPAEVTRVEEKAAAVAFERPETELMQLLEPCRLDSDQQTGAAVHDDQPARVASAGGVYPFAPARPRHRDSRSSGGARLAERIAAARDAIAHNGGLRPAPSATTAMPAAGDRRALQAGIVALAIAVAVVIFELAANASLRQRVATLETAAQAQAETLAEVQIKLTAESGRERLASLDHRVEALAVSVAALETGRLQPVSETPAGAVEQASQPVATQAASGNEAATRPQAATGGEPSVATRGDNGPWVINLVSLYDQAAAERFTRQARDHGIAVVQNRTQVDGRPVWRMQVTGFATRDAASAYSDANIHKLGLEKAWIFKR